MTGNGNDPKFNNIPTSFDVNPDAAGMEYTCPATCTSSCPHSPCASLATQDGRELCWLNFLNAFGVKDKSGHALTLNTATDLYVQKSIYFKPSGSIASEGSSGGAPSNVIAKIPRLVK